MEEANEKALMGFFIYGISLVYGVLPKQEAAALRRIRAMSELIIKQKGQL